MIGVFLHYIILDMLFFTFFFHVTNFFSHYISFYGNFFGGFCCFSNCLWGVQKKTLENPSLLGHMGYLGLSGLHMSSEARPTP